MNPVIGEYIRPEVVSYLCFFVVLGLTFGGALLAVLPKNIIYNVFGLANSLVGVAGLFIFLGSEFLAVMEILIYVGAICIAIVFAIMLSQPMHIQIPKRYRPKVALSFLLSVGMFVVLSVAISRTPWQQPAVRVGEWSVKRLGQLLLTRYELLFELISLALLVAIVGAIITAAAVSDTEADKAEPQRKEGGGDEPA